MPESTVPPPREFDFSGRSPTQSLSGPAPAVTTGEPQAAPSEKVEVRMPVLIEYYPPFYPISDRMRGAEGRVLVGLFVTETGLVESPTILSSTVPAYSEEVLKAAAQWRFLPARAEGKAVRFPVRIPVTFASEYGSAGMDRSSPLVRIKVSGDTYYSVDDNGRFSPANGDVVPLTRVEPAFTLPEGVKELRVTLKIRVDEQGRVLNPEVADSSGTDFDKAALKAIQYWQFLPKLKNGKPVATSAKLPLRVAR